MRFSLTVPLKSIMNPLFDRHNHERLELCRELGDRRITSYFGGIHLALCDFDFNAGTCRAGTAAQALPQHV